MKKIIYMILVTCVASPVFGQNSGVSVSAGIGSFHLSELKSYQEQLNSRLPVEATGFDFFPNYTSIRINLFRQPAEKVRYGITYGFSTTGAHSNYADYSGILNLDQNITSYQLGISGGYRLLQMNFTRTTLEMMVYGDLRLGYVRDEVQMNINTDYYYENSRMILNAFTPLAEAGIDAMFRFTKVSLGISGGYLYDTGSKFKEGNSSSLNQTVSLRPTEELHSGLSGFRAGLKLILWFNNSPFIE